MAADLYSVFLQGLEVFAHHGVTEAERRVGQRYRIDIDMEVRGTATVTDNVTNTVDYTEVATLIQSRMTAISCSTVERLASLVAEEILADYPGVQEIRLRIAKKLPPMPGIVEAAGVELRLRRPE